MNIEKNTRIYVYLDIWSRSRTNFLLKKWSKTFRSNQISSCSENAIWFHITFPSNNLDLISNHHFLWSAPTLKITSLSTLKNPTYDETADSDWKSYHPHFWIFSYNSEDSSSELLRSKKFQKKPSMILAFETIATSPSFTFPDFKDHWNRHFDLPLA